MATNLHPAAVCESDFTCTDVYDESLRIGGTMASLQDGVVRRECGAVVVLDDAPPQRRSKRTANHLRNVKLDRLVSSESLEVDDDDDDYDTGSLSSTSSDFVCATVPSSPSSTRSYDDAVDTIFFHPLSQQCTEDENMSLTSNPLGVVESTMRPRREPRTHLSIYDSIGSYSMLRIAYLLVTLVIMLADGLQGRSPETKHVTIKCYRSIRQMTYFLFFVFFSWIYSQPF